MIVNAKIENIEDDLVRNLGLQKFKKMQTFLRNKTGNIYAIMTFFQGRYRVLLKQIEQNARKQKYIHLYASKEKDEAKKITSILRQYLTNFD